MEKKHGAKLLYLLPILGFSWFAAAPANQGTAPDLSEYVYLHMTRGEAAPPASSCRAKAEDKRN